MLASAIRKLKPDANPGPGPDADFVVVVDQDAERTERITVWREEKLGPRPTLAMLQTARLLALREERKREMGRKAKEAFDQAYPFGGAVERDMMKRKRPLDPRTSKDLEIEDRLQDRLAAVEAAGKGPGLTPEQAEAEITAVQW